MPTYRLPSCGDIAYALMSPYSGRHRLIIGLCFATFFAKIYRQSPILATFNTPAAAAAKARLNRQSIIYEASLLKGSSILMLCLPAHFRQEEERPGFQFVLSLLRLSLTFQFDDADGVEIRGSAHNASS